MCYKSGFFLIVVISGICFSSQLHSVVDSTVAATIVVPDSVQAASEVLDSSDILNFPNVDTLIEKALTDEVLPKEKSGPVLIKRTYDYKSQVRLGISMMLFIAIIFGTAQSWNP